MINFDLHIHSIASRYKESANIVDESTVENANILMERLNEANVSLFSITDHNRFNKELYMKLDTLIESDRYEKVKGLVAGIEFDVQIDSNMNKCHIITIFDAKNDKDNYQKIYSVIEENKLEDKGDFYSRKQYEEILRKINLDVILIACQRNSLDRHDGKHNSLSESTKEPEYYLKTGYINALEFQRPNVEGIILDNLKSVPNNIMLVMGSDCHDWREYPYHSKNNKNTQFRHSRAKILPTFKGLLMAVTSPETRINQPENSNRDYIENFKIGDNEHTLVNGINAIIGENGSGKTTLLNLLVGNQSKKHTRDLIKNNIMTCDLMDANKQLYIGQGDIVEKFGDRKLFPDDNFEPIDNSKFKTAYKEFANDIMKYIRSNIKAKEALDKLSKEELEYNELIDSETYFIHLDVPSDYSELENEHTAHYKNLEEVLDKVKTMEQKAYFDKYNKELTKVSELLNSIYEKISDDYKKIETEKLVKNLIVSRTNSYKTKIEGAASTKDKDQKNFLDKRRDFINFINDAINKNMRTNLFPNKPDIVNGYSKNPKFGFSFNSETNYHGKDVLDDFLSRMFIQEYSNIDKLKNIDTELSLVEAIRNCTDSKNINTIYEKNLENFLNDFCICNNYIVDSSQSNKTLGNTLGELSLAYFKYMTEHEKETSIFLIDQPEDHISNNNISKKLLSYFNSIRNKKQIILVTHNPLLVVNQDVDQVIFVNNRNDKINISAGCLEYEDENINILDIVAENMDGGKDSIEKRLKVYGKED